MHPDFNAVIIPWKDNRSSAMAASSTANHVPLEFQVARGEHCLSSIFPVDCRRNNAKDECAVFSKNFHASRCGVMQPGFLDVLTGKTDTRTLSSSKMIAVSPSSCLCTNPVTSDQLAGVGVSDEYLRAHRK